MMMNPDKWEYVETGPGANVAAGKFKIDAHWQGTASSNEIREVMRLIAAAPTLYAALVDLVRQLPSDERLADFNLDRAEAAIALATEPSNHQEDGE